MSHFWLFQLEKNTTSGAASATGAILDCLWWPTTTPPTHLASSGARLVRNVQSSLFLYLSPQYGPAPLPALFATSLTGISTLLSMGHHFFHASRDHVSSKFAPTPGILAREHFQIRGTLPNQKLSSKTLCSALGLCFFIEKLQWFINPHETVKLSSWKI